MTQESIPKLIASLSIPTILSMLVTNIYNLVDTAFVGKLGTSESAAVGVIFGREVWTRRVPPEPRPQGSPAPWVRDCCYP